MRSRHPRTPQSGLTRYETLHCRADKVRLPVWCQRSHFQMLRRLSSKFMGRRNVEALWSGHQGTATPNLNSALFIQTPTSASFSDLRQPAHQASDLLVEDTYVSLPNRSCMYLFTPQQTSAWNLQPHPHRRKPQATPRCLSATWKT